MSIEGQDYSLSLDQCHLHMKIKTDFSQKQLCHSLPNFVCKLLDALKIKCITMMLVT